MYYIFEFLLIAVGVFACYFPLVMIKKGIKRAVRKKLVINKA
jgi:hypothetical protein